MKSWTEIPTKLKMSTIESTFAAACRENGVTLTLTADQVHLMLAEKFGRCRTKSELRIMVNSHFVSM